MKILKGQHALARDISWLSFNARVMQEAADKNVPLKERIKFLGIFSNNLDEFFRVRVAALKRMIELGSKASMHLEYQPENILNIIQDRVMKMQDEFLEVWHAILTELQQQRIRIIDERKLTTKQKNYIEVFYDEQLRSTLVPLMIENLKEFPVLNDGSMYLACKLENSKDKKEKQFSLISVPTRSLSRFVLLPSKKNTHTIILLEDVIRYCLPKLFAFLGFDTFSAHSIKLTRDAEIDIENDLTLSYLQLVEKGLKKRKWGKPVRLVFDRDIPADLLAYLVRRLNLSHKDNLMPGGRIHNFKDFMKFPANVFITNKKAEKPFIHPAFTGSNNVTARVLEKDILLHFPYHSFDSLIDLLRESAMDPLVESIRITCYRLAERSKIVNALINASRNGKKVVVIIELRARFDEEANLNWKQQMEDAGIQVITGTPTMKIHAKIGLIEKRNNGKICRYGFVSTGNLNENTAKTYSDHCLLTANKKIMHELKLVFSALEKPSQFVRLMPKTNFLWVSPNNMREKIIKLINQEMQHARKKRKASIIVKLNSLTDAKLIDRLFIAAKNGVKIEMVIRSICSMPPIPEKWSSNVRITSIVDEFLEHSRLLLFENAGNNIAFISSADWMVRNLDHRVEVACPIIDRTLVSEIKNILLAQLRDNVKARLIDENQMNSYVITNTTKKTRAQKETHRLLKKRLSNKALYLD